MDKTHVETVCQPGQGAATCSFLMIGPEGFCCAKGTGVEPILQRRRAERDMVALSDNCGGPPDYDPLGGLHGQDPA